MKNLFGLLFHLLNNLKQTLYFIVGPTCIGKSSLAIRLAKKINGIIINADSMQVYSNLEIITARPSKNDHKKIIHELYGYVDGSERYNVAKWINDILKIININYEKNCPCIIVGGTGMYITALLNGLFDIPSIPEFYKKKSEALFNKKGVNNFFKIVEKFDPESLTNLSQNDTLRLRRVWEVYNFTGITFSQWKKKQNKNFLNKFNNQVYLFTPDRESIYNLVNSRFESMVKLGAIEEVEKLILLNLDLSLPIMRAHGVPEISNYLSKKISLEDCIQRGQQVTRNYVKRQLSWWRSSKIDIHQNFQEFPNKIDENMIKI